MRHLVNHVWSPPLDHEVHVGVPRAETLHLLRNGDPRRVHVDPVRGLVIRGVADRAALSEKRHDAHPFAIDEISMVKALDPKERRARELLAACPRLRLVKQRSELGELLIHNDVHDAVSGSAVTLHETIRSATARTTASLSPCKTGSRASARTPVVRREETIPIATARSMSVITCKASAPCGDTREFAPSPSVPSPA